MSEPTKVIPSSFSLRPNNSAVNLSVISRIDKESSTEPVPIMFKYKRYFILCGFYHTLSFNSVQTICLT